MLNTNKRTFGTIGEEIAVDYLLKNDFRMLAQNFRYSRLGEVDIIAREKEYLCFIEVKTRTSTAFGSPAESVTYKKRQNIKKIASIYMSQNGLHNSFVRFDIIEILGFKKNDEFIMKSINLIRAAF